ncbi:MAG: two-component system, NtrC family, response regulator [Acidobacteriota bacterium]|nr:two-component system, NtrC family, response regulator [Acidobacteriota bacterium]
MNKTIKILLVDDDINWRNLMKEVLEKGDANYDVITADNGHQAIDLIGKKEFHIVITDIRMESEFSGLKILDYVKENFPIIPVIMLTAYSSVQTAKDSIKKGAFDFFVKGEDDASNEELRRKVAEALMQREIDKKKTSIIK